MSSSGKSRRLDYVLINMIAILGFEVNIIGDLYDRENFHF